MHTHVQKNNELQTIADVALQSHKDQNMEHKYDEKVCWFACACSMYVLCYDDMECLLGLDLMMCFIGYMVCNISL